MTKSLKEVAEKYGDKLHDIAEANTQRNEDGLAVWDDDNELPEMSSESHWYINEVQANQIINAPRTPIRETGVLSDVMLPKAERLAIAREILNSRKWDAPSA